MSVISAIHAREILDSRGYPTVEVDVSLTALNSRGRASVPSGASTGSHEAIELRDNDKKRYLGKGVSKAVGFINGEIRDALLGKNPTPLSNIDQKLIELDGTKNKSHFGANATLAVSIAVARALASEARTPLYRNLSDEGKLTLPVPMMNVINGGAHADNNLAIQEFMILPIGMKSFSDALRCGAEIFQHLKILLKEKKLSTAVGDEGGFAPDLESNTQALELILEATHLAGYQPGHDVYLGLDVAASEIYRNNLYHLHSENRELSSSDWVTYLMNLTSKYPIISIEDGMAENDIDGWKKLTNELGHKIQLVGDDLFVTNTEIFKPYIEQGLANAILIKPNQIGTLTETFSALKMAREASYNTIISHRSGETEDAFISDFAVATSAGQIKTGSLCRSDRIAKYNQLLRIEESLKEHAIYAGTSVFRRYL